MTAPGATSIVVTGTGTGIGKTVFAAGLAGILGYRYWKPIQSGLAGETDRDTVARLSGQGATGTLAEAYRLTKPLSPHRAAEIDGVTIDVARLDPPASPLVIEGAGGLMVPITRSLLQVDLFERWRLPVVLVAGTGLGTINHSLLSLEALGRRGVKVIGVAFVGDANDDNESTICVMGGVRRLGRLPRLEPLTAEALASAFRANFSVAEFAA